MYLHGNSRKKLRTQKPKTTEIINTGILGGYVQVHLTSEPAVKTLLYNNKQFFVHCATAAAT